MNDSLLKVRYSRTGGLSTAALVIALLVGCKEPPTIVEDEIRPVRFSIVEIGGAAMSRSFSGIAQPGSASRLSFRVSGNVQTVAVDLGDSVSAGDLLAELDSSDYELGVQEASAAASQARAEARNAEAQYQRVIALYENNTASRAELDGARAASESAAAATRSIRNRLQMARDQVQYCRLEAPVDGAVASIEVEVNENVQAGQIVVLLTSGTDTEPEVLVDIPETFIALIEQGSIVSVRFDAIEGRFFEATVTEVGVTRGQRSATFPVTVRLNQPDPDVRPGMAAEVTFSLGGEEEDGIWVPAHAVAEDRDGRYVYLVDVSVPAGGEFGTIERRDVEVGDLDERGFEITLGLEGGEALVTAGVHRIWQDLVVRLPNGETPAEPDPGEPPAVEEQPATEEPPATEESPGDGE